MNQKYVLEEGWGVVVVFQALRFVPGTAGMGQYLRS